MRIITEVRSRIPYLQSPIRLDMRFLLFLLLLPALVEAQSITWADSIANIVYENCSYCHRTGGIAPFELLTYQDAVANASLIYHVIEQNEMPPWPADPHYRRFAFEEILTYEQKQAILTWLDGGFPEGDQANAPPQPYFPPNGSNLETIDMTLAIDPYTLQTNTDEYRWYVIENPFSETIYVNKIEVIAGLDEVVHHADVSYDITGISLANDQADPLPGFNSSTGSPNYSFYMNAWQPGGNIAAYPEGWGIAVPPNADFVLEIHYGPGGIGLTDTTKMHLEFVTNTSNVRPISVGWLLGQSPPIMVDGPLVIPANEVVTFHQERTLTSTTSFISICPHMHLLGKSYKVWAVTPANDTIKLIDIPQWDLHWQKYYMFRNIQVLEAGTTIYSEGVYDNTLANHDNPFNPPQTAYQGTSTLDEMFLTYFIYAPYQAGDENVILDDSPLVDITASIHSPTIETLDVFPNPVSDQIHLSGIGRGQVTVIDAFGKTVVSEACLGPTYSADLAELSSGVYLIQWVGEDRIAVGRFVKQ